MNAKLWIKKWAVDPGKWFGLEYSDVLVEYVPLVIQPRRQRDILEQIIVHDFDEED